MFGCYEQYHKRGCVMSSAQPVTVFSNYYHPFIFFVICTEVNTPLMLFQNMIVASRDTPFTSALSCMPVTYI